ncbi:MAG TPA: PEGA domain-containing protein [Atribacterota bacterium]|nr:PEGA domain-containing protein [Atribacterota bacterium]
MKLLDKKDKNSQFNRFPSFAFTILYILILIISVSFIFTASAQEEIKKSIQVINPRPDFALSLRLDKGTGATYAPGEKIRIYFRSTKSAYVTIFGYDSRGNIRLLFPNQYQRNNSIEANREYHIDGVIEQGTSTGIEYVQGFATAEPVIVTREMERKIVKENFPIIGEGINLFTQRIKGILSALPPQRWVSSETLHYQVINRTAENGQLRVSSSPSGAEVYLSNRYAGRTPLSMEQIRVGEYVMRIEQPGYQIWSRTIRINPNRTTTLNADLERIKQYGSIAIRCNENNARVYLDGQYKGQTEKNRNVILEQVSEGSHDVRITLSGYREWTQRVQVRPNQRVQVNVTLERIIQTGTIVIRSNENNARIYLDGQYKGRTERNRNIVLEDVPEGYHDVRITLDGYIDWFQSIQLRSNQRIQLNVSLEKLVRTGTLEIDSNVDNAMIYLDGAYQRRTSANRSVTIDNIQGGSYELQITKEGYLDYITNIRITPGQTYYIDVRMEPEQRKGAIAIHCNESNARIFINGVYNTTTSANQTRMISELQEGVYEIAVIKDGFRTWLDEIRVYPGETSSVFINLIRVEN